MSGPKNVKKGSSRGEDKYNLPSFSLWLQSFININRETIRSASAIPAITG